MLLASSVMALAMRPYCLFPDIHGDQMVFVAEDDLWMLDLGNGALKRLVSNLGVISRPSFSPDGKWIAFLSLRGGASVTEAFATPAGGGEVRQVTFLGSSSTSIAGWTADNRLVVSTDFEHPFNGGKELYSVGLGGDYPRPLNLGPATNVIFSGERVFLGRYTNEVIWWKRYRGGTRGKVWSSSDGGKTFSPFLEMETGITSPMWAGGRLYFITDSEGCGNIYSVDSAGKDLRKHTSLNGFYARNAMTDGSRIVFHSAGEIYLLELSTGKVTRVEVDIPASSLRKQSRFVDNHSFTTEFAVNGSGELVSFVIRGRLFAMGSWEGPVFPVSFDEPGRVRLASFLPESDSVVAVTDAGGDEKVFTHSLRDGRRNVVDHDYGVIVGLYPDPKGKRAIVANNRFELLLVDLEKGNVSMLDKSDSGIVEGVSWHPSGKFAAYTYPTMVNRNVIVIADVESGVKKRVTSEGSFDFSPAFDPKGRYLYYLSQRSLDPVYDKIVFDLGYPVAAKPYAVALRRGVRSPFSPQPAILSGKAEESMEVEMEGIEERAEPFPVPAGDYTKILCSEGRVMFLRFPVEGSMKYWTISRTGRDNGALEGYNLEERKPFTAVSGISDAVLSLDGKQLMVAAEDRFRILDSTKTDEKMTQEQECSKHTGYIDTGRIKCSVRPQDEWRQMFRESWRLMKENYWNASRVGKEWDAVYDRYLPVVERVGSRGELSDLIRELQGELGTSHSYVIGGDISQDRGFRVGRLGARLAFNGRGYEILEIYKGDPSNENEKSPLLSATVPIAAGDTITSLAGVRLSESVTPQKALLNLHDEEVLASVESAGVERVTSLTVLGDDRTLLYRNWVEKNRKMVHELSGGRLGYIHIPDMGPSGFNEFHRYLPEETARDGLVVDARYNAGGHISELILEKLNRNIIGFDRPRKGRTETYPRYSVNGPMVAVTNEMAGSDGDIFSHSFKLYNMGPLIGTRTWGGVVGISPIIELVDGTVITQPQFAFWFKDVGWGVENYGTDPTIEVDIAPQDFARGHDPQLLTAVKECLSLISSNGRKLEQPGMP